MLASMHNIVKHLNLPPNDIVHIESFAFEFKRTCILDFGITFRLFCRIETHHRASTSVNVPIRYASYSKRASKSRTRSKGHVEDVAARTMELETCLGSHVP